MGQLTLNVQIDLDRIGQDFESEESALKWINQCLNVNTNHCKVHASITAVPTLVLNMEGGIIQSESATRPVRLIILDADVEGVEEDRVLKIDGYDVFVTDGEVQIDPTYVDRITTELSSMESDLEVHRG